MDFTSDESKAILSKSFSLIEKTKEKLRQIDHSNFPTPSTQAGIDLLIDSLDLIEKSPNLVSIDPAVLYKTLFNIQNLVDILNDSSSDFISWPLVSYCDEIWHQFFGNNGPKLFYSLTTEHNYIMLRFTSKLASLLEGLMPEDDINRFISNRDIYCLQLASSEDANLPLYANIGHEFGHAVFDSRTNDIGLELEKNFVIALNNIYSDLNKIDPTLAKQKCIRIIHIIISFAKELFCDLVGALLMGPSFFLSLYEFSWGQSKSTWSIILSPDNRTIRAYPSYNYRLFCIAQQINLDSFCNNAVRDFNIIKSDQLKTLAEGLKTCPIDHAIDNIEVLPDYYKEADEIKTVMTARLNEIKGALNSFLADCAGLVRGWYTISNDLVNTSDLAQLLLRIENRILPNIIPDNSLLGQPASFAAILNASALYRIYLLVNERSLNYPDLSRETKIVERLTAKSLEVSFIQRKYKEWKNN